jgi:hypothetical protein
MVTVDRLVLLSTVLFAIAALLVLISISRPRWILSGNKGRQFLDNKLKILFLKEDIIRIFHNRILRLFYKKK